MPGYSRLTPSYNPILSHTQTINGMAGSPPYMMTRDTGQHQMAGMKKDDKYWERRR